jgi:imidazole glycerol-phosphate synthase subunit HisH
MIVVVDYGMGNLGSVLNMLRRIGVQAAVARDPEGVRAAEKILLPGVGSFDAAMSRIAAAGFREVLDHKAVAEKVPILGICLGMQLLTRGSEEGRLPGLGWIPADTIRFPARPGVKVPHMGWNVAVPVSPSSLTADLPEESRFYFVHSYYVKVDSEADSVMRTTHGVTFDSVIQRDNIFGAQFHPEKSHKFGMNLLKNFVSL